MSTVLPPGAVPLDLDEVSRWSPWPARLLGLEAGEREARTPDSVLREYDRDKYGRLLDLHRADPGLGFEELKGHEVGDGQVVLSVGDHLALAPARAAAAFARDLVLGAVARRLPGASALLDLGCGYGYHLHHAAARHPGLRLRGGEFSPRGRELGRRLGVDVRAYDAASSAGVGADAVGDGLGEGLGDALVVLMSMVVSQLPTAELAVDSLLPLRDRVAAVVVVDVVAEVQPPGLLGLMRRRYVQVNRYSWDLLAVLERRPDVEVLDVAPNAVGTNFLLPCSLVTWRFR